MEPRLTRREVQVLELVRSGKTNVEIARALFIEIDTVKFHVRNIMLKTGVHNRVALALWANGLALAALEDDTGSQHAPTT